MKKRLLSLLLAVLMLASVAVIPAQADTCKGAVTTTALNMRSEANTSSTIKTTMPTGSDVLVLSSSNGWSKIVYKGMEGYASQQYLKNKDEIKGSFGTGTVTGNNVRLRSEAGTGGSIVGTFNKGATFSVVGASGGWFAVDYNGKTCYMSMDYMTVSVAAKEDPKPTETPEPTDTPTSDTGYTGKIIGTSVRMRSSASTGSDTLGYYSNGVTMTVLGSVSGWYKVSYNGKNGFVSSAYMQIVPNESFSPVREGSVNANGVRLRMGPSASDFSIIQSCNKGTALKVSGEYGDWYEVSINGTYGYMSKTYVTVGESKPQDPKPSEEPLDGVGTITGNGVRMRSGPGTNYSTIGYYNKGTQMTITGKSGNWYAVDYKGTKGYVSTSYMTRGTYNSQAQQIVNTALQYQGVPYVWGGTSPKGFDCSGLVYYVYAQYGYSLQRRASLQYAYNGTPVSKSDLQPGDLVFFSDDVDPIGHVGMYIGNGEFVHASSGKGCVTVSQLSASYYSQHYTGARRIVT